MKTSCFFALGFCVLVMAWCASAADAATFVVNSTADGTAACAPSPGTCTLRAAVLAANASPGADTITLPAGGYGLNLPGRNEDAALTGDLDVTDTLTIVGAGATTTFVGGTLDRVFDVPLGGGAAPTFTVSGLTVDLGCASPGSGLRARVAAA